MSTLEELTKQLIEQPTWNDQDINNFSHFIRMRRKDCKFYSVTDGTTGDTFVIIKWPHQIPELPKIL